MGCSEPEPVPGVSVSGSIRVDSEPLKFGRITFRPASGTSGPVATSLVEDGQYAIEAEKGPWPGTFRVIVETIPQHIIDLAHGKFEEDRTQEKAPEPMISREFNTDTRLNATVQAEGENIFDFEVKWAPAGR
ncbi:hypothetical protein AB1L42_14765 [Thalassoglobus sp. JC818]|uniref:hypothetical protein n=1 Tax=Thalassoglobus sp. JC818 TaxID=3232136 RepID=UPI003459FF22